MGRHIQLPLKNKLFFSIPARGGGNYAQKTNAQGTQIYPLNTGALFLSCLDMEYPPVWEFAKPEDFKTFAFRAANTVPMGLEVIL